jgi:hypothetical protein
MKKRVSIFDPILKIFRIGIEEGGFIKTSDGKVRPVRQFPEKEDKPYFEPVKKRKNE